MFFLQGSFTTFSDVVIGVLVGKVDEIVATVVVGTIISETNGDSGGGAAGAVICGVTFAGTNVLVELTNGGRWLVAASAIADGWVLQQTVLCRVGSEPLVFI